jgi:hypothetical protein
MRLQSLARDLSLRFDAKAVHLLSRTDDAAECSIPLLEVADLREPESRTMPTDPFSYHEISTVDQFGLGDPYIINEADIERGSDEERIKVKAEKGDISLPQPGTILVPRVRPALGKFVLVGNGNQTYYTTAFLEAHPKGITPELLYCVLKHPIVLSQLDRLARIGKGYPTISAFELGRFVRVPAALLQVPSALQANVGGELNEAFVRLTNVRRERQLIDAVMIQHLNPAVNLTVPSKAFSRSSAAIGASFELRMSAHYLQPAATQLTSDLRESDTVKIASLCAIPISLGISPELGVQDSEYYYLGPQAMASERLDPDKLLFVSQEYFDTNAQLYRVQQGDIFLRRSGASLGKIMYFDSEIPCIFSDFMMRIRFRDRIMAEFAAYWMRSSLFQALLRVTAVVGKGLQNIYPSQVELMPVPDPETHDIRTIVNAVQAARSSNDLLRMQATHIIASLQEQLSNDLGFADLARMLQV